MPGIGAMPLFCDTNCNRPRSNKQNVSRKTAWETFCLEGVALKARSLAGPLTS